MPASAVTPERFAKGMTFDEYVKYVGTPENLAREAFSAYHPDAGSIGGPRKDNSAVFRERYAKAKLADYQVAAIKWLAAQPNGPAKILVISEDWSSDCRRDVSMLARLAEDDSEMGMQMMKNLAISLGKRLRLQNWRAARSAEREVSAQVS